MTAVADFDSYTRFYDQNTHDLVKTMTENGSKGSRYFHKREFIELIYLARGLSKPETD